MAYSTAAVSKVSIKRNIEKFKWEGSKKFSLGKRIEFSNKNITNECFFFFIFFVYRNLTRGGTIMISRDFTLEKKKLYRSYQQDH